MICKSLNFVKTTNGNIAVMFAMLAPILLCLIGGTIDYFLYHKHIATLQEIADQSAIAGAREYVLSGQKEEAPVVASEAIAMHAMQEETSLAPLMAKSAVAKGSASSGSTTNDTVTVTVQGIFKPTFLVSFFKPEINISATSTAKGYFAANLCILSLDSNNVGAIALEGNSQITGAQCAVHLNSSNTSSLQASGNSVLSTIQTSTSGGYTGSLSNFTPKPLTDYPTLIDPLKSRQGPNIGSCTESNLVLSDFVGTIDPGVYCGGLEITGTSDVTLNPGIYIIKNGDLLLKDSTKFAGTGVGFYFTGGNSHFQFLDDVEVNLSGPETGIMAGLLIFQDRNMGSEPDSVIKSSKVDQLVGTIYLPKGDLLIDTDSEVAEASAFTAIIADELWLKKSAHLVINSDYEATGVPLPSGFTGGPIVTLRE